MYTENWVQYEIIEKLNVKAFNWVIRNEARLEMATVPLTVEKETEVVLFLRSHFLQVFCIKLG